MDLIVTIAGFPKSGKTALAEAVRRLLTANLEIESVTSEDPDSQKMLMVPTGKLKDILGSKKIHIQTVGLEPKFFEAVPKNSRKKVAGKILSNAHTEAMTRGQETTAQSDRHIICEIGRLFWGDNKQCYDGGAVLRELRKRMQFVVSKSSDVEDDDELGTLLQDLDRIPKVEIAHPSGKVRRCPVSCRGRMCILPHEHKGMHVASEEGKPDYSWYDTKTVRAIHKKCSNLVCTLPHGHKGEHIARNTERHIARNTERLHSTCGKRHAPDTDCPDEDDSQIGDECFTKDCSLERGHEGHHKYPDGSTIPGKRCERRRAGIGARCVRHDAHVGRHEFDVPGAKCHAVQGAKHCVLSAGHTGNHSFFGKKS